MARTALVIGTGSAVSGAVRRALVADGHRVAVTFGDAGSPEVLVARCDLADAASIGSVFDRVENNFGAVEILVVDAGVHRNPPPSEDTDADVGIAVRTGLRAVSVAADRAREPMQRAGWGRMIFLASPTAMLDEIGPARYAGFLVNSGLSGLAESLTYELARDNIAVNVVAPGLIEGDECVQLLPGKRKHPMWNIPAERAGRPEEVADVVAFLGSERAGYLTGLTVRVDGGVGIRPGVANRL